MTDSAEEVSEVVGIRFDRRGPLAWYRAGDVPADVRNWVVAKRDGFEAVGQVVVGRGQCLSFPGDPRELPGLIRGASAEEIPLPPEGGGKKLLESLPPSPSES